MSGRRDTDERHDRHDRRLNLAIFFLVALVLIAAAIAIGIGLLTAD